MRYTELREQLRLARRREKLTQAALAERSGASRITIARLEGGSAHDLRVGTLFRLCEALRLELRAESAGGTASPGVLLARERERAERLERRLAHAALAVRLLEASEEAGAGARGSSARGGGSLGARRPLQQPLHHALARAAPRAGCAGGEPTVEAGRLG